jgi:hypothetical protein
MGIDVIKKITSHKPHIIYWGGSANFKDITTI